MPDSRYRCTKTRIAIVATFLILALLSTYLLKRFVFSEPISRLDFEPKLEESKSLIWINTADEQEESKWASTVEEFIDNYKTIQADGLSCSYENGLRSGPDTFCRADITKMSGCVWGQDDKYGYMGKVSKPCVVLKLDNLEDWIPDPYTIDDLQEINMPESIANQIRRLNSSTNPIERRKLDTIWISCEGMNVLDKEHILEVGVKFYTPGYPNFPGIPGFYFPYAEQSGYQTPFVFVQFEHISPNILVAVECKAWAKNIDPDSKLPYQSVQFEILID